MIHRNLVLLISLSFSWLASSRVWAEFGEYYCDVSNGPAMRAAINSYLNPTESSRGCRKVIRILPGTEFSLQEPIQITLPPPAGQTFGTAIRTCVSPGGPVSDGAACEAAPAGDVIIDMSSVQGSCPIRISRGARMDFFNLKVISTFPEYTFCEEGRNFALPMEDRNSEFAWIRNVQIIPADGVPPQCSFQYDPVLKMVNWTVRNANHVMVYKGQDSVFDYSAEIGTDEYSRSIRQGSVYARALYETTYKLVASSPNGQSCERVVVAGSLRRTSIPNPPPQPRPSLNLPSGK
ncbi:MAG: hypothetical protein U1F66_11000 [bacterium]